MMCWSRYFSHFVDSTSRFFFKKPNPSSRCLHLASGPVSTAGQLCSIVPLTDKIQNRLRSTVRRGFCNTAWQYHSRNISNFKPVEMAYKMNMPVSGCDENLCPVIFLHGLSDSKEAWGDIPKIIADKTRRKTYSLDARNHGDSEWNDAFDFDLNATDVLFFMDNHSIQRAVLIGHSMGGITSIKASLKCPDRVEMMVVEDMYVERVPQEVLNSMMDYLALLQEAVKKVPSDYNMKEAQKFILDYLFMKLSSEIQSVGTRESLDNIFLALKKDENGRYAYKTNMKVVEKILQDGQAILSDPKGVFQGPSYFIYGSISPFRVGEKAEHILKFFPAAEFFPIEGADHNVHPQFPNVFTEVVLNCILKLKK